MELNKMVVVHINETFVARPETFIYHYVSNLKSFHPIFLAKKFENLEQFPLPRRDIYQVPLKRYTPKWLYYGSLRRFLGIHISPEEQILRKRKVKLIHAHFGPHGCAALKLRRKLKIPLVTNFYGYDVSKLARDAEWVKRYQVLFREGDLFLAEGEFLKSKLIELGCPEHKIQIQRIAIPIDRITFVPRQHKKKGEKVILLFSGRFVEKKGLIHALSAIKNVHNENKDFEFRIIGDGALKPAIETFIQEHQMSDYVKLLGFLSYSDYLRELQRSDIFIHPSVIAEDGDSEGGAPTSILEAQAAGLPVLATYHADIPNIVVPGKSALLSKERDVRGLADNIRYLLENQDSWAEMGQAGRQLVEQYHDIRKELGSLEQKYRAVIE